MSCHGVTTGTVSNLRTYLIRRLDGVEQDYIVDKKCNGSELLDKVRREREMQRGRLSPGKISTEPEGRCLARLKLAMHNGPWYEL